MKARLKRIRRRVFRTRRRLKRHLGWLTPLRVQVYGGYAGPGGTVVWGRALEDREPSQATMEDSTFVNVVRALRQFDTSELPGLELELEVGGSRTRVKTDDEGYFRASLSPPTTEAGAARTLDVVVHVVDAPVDVDFDPVARGRVFSPEKSAKFAVISDVDDTVLRSHVRNRLKLAYVTLFKNALRRKSFPGTQAFYDSLAHTGAPFFYVSRSVWNVHGLIKDFLRVQSLPAGPVILRSAQLFSGRADRRGHKPREIERILRTFPDLPVVLVGDGGQADPDIYADIAASSPGRVQAIFIRNLSDPSEGQALQEHLEARCPLGTRVHVFDHADEALERARAWGLTSD